MLPLSASLLRPQSLSAVRFFLLSLQVGLPLSGLVPFLCCPFLCTPALLLLLLFGLVCRPGLFGRVADALTG